MHGNHSIQVQEQLERFRRDIYELRRQKTTPSVIPSRVKEADHFTFQLTEPMTSPSSEANVYTMDQTTLVAATVQVFNTLDDFAHLTTNDWGVCFCTQDETTGDDVYWAIHPEAPGNGGGGEEIIWCSFKLTADLTFGTPSAAAEILASNDAGYPAGTAITVLNSPSNNFNAYADLTGTGGNPAVGWAVRDPSTGNWPVVNVNEPAELSEAEITQATHTWPADPARGGGIAQQIAGGITQIGNWKSLSEYPRSWLPGDQTATNVNIGNPYNFVLETYQSPAPFNKILMAWDRALTQFVVVETMPAATPRIRCVMTANAPSLTGTATAVVSSSSFDVVEPDSTHHMGDLPADLTVSQVIDPLRVLEHAKSGDFFIAEFRPRTNQWFAVEIEKGPERFFSFELKTAPIGNPATVTVDIFDARDQTTALVTDATMIANHQMFSDMEVGDVGTCVRSKDEFFAVNAPCDPEPGPVIPTP